MDVLWLASWYPNKTDPFNGDFIQRHAVAVSASARCRVTVIHVAKDTGGLASWETETSTSAGGWLTERISYFRSLQTPFSALNRLLSQVRAFRLYARAIRRYIREHGRPPFIHVHVCMNAGILALWAKYRWKIPYLVTEHFTGYIPGSEGDYYSRPFVYRWVNRLILKKAEGIHTVSRFLLECLEPITPLRNPVVIPNVVNTRLFRPSEAGSERPFCFIHVSAFQAFKNVRGILDAFTLLGRKRSDWQLVLAGPADERIRLYAEKTGLSGHIRWTGELPYEGIAAHMQQADALVHFSRYETQGCVILEALASGLPVVSSEVGGVPEILGPEDGLLVPSEDIPALAGALDRMITEYDRFDRPRIARAASARYGYDNVGKEMMGYYASIFKGEAAGDAAAPAPSGASR